MPLWKEGRRIKPLGGYAAEMGIRDIKVKLRHRSHMGQNPKFLICLSCGFKTAVKRVRRRCPVCNEQMRVNREKS